MEIGAWSTQLEGEHHPLLRDPKTNLIARSEFMGLDAQVRLADGSRRQAVNFDSAATTPALSCVVDEILAQLPFYGSIGRGKGQKSTCSTEVFEDARAVVLGFLSAPADEYSCFFSGTTTEALNKLAGALIESPDDVVLVTRSEHHANDLPWRERAKMRYVEVDELGRLRMDEFAEHLADGKVKVVSVQAASNVTGYVHDVHAIARMAHAAGAIMVVDGAQIAAHRAFSMKGASPEEDIDLFALSAHKMYAPFGGGAVVGKTALLDAHVPRYRGGGMVDVVSDYDCTWLGAPELYEAGSPNFVGQVALARAITALEEVGFEAIQAHEQVLLRKALDGLAAIDGVRLYADSENISDRVGVLTFNVDGVDAAELAARLADDHAIAVRQGEFCAHPLCHRLLGISDDDIVAGMRTPGFVPPAMVRVSFGMYSTEDEVDQLIEAVAQIAGRA